MKKLIILIIPILLLTGCETPTTYKTEETNNLEYTAFVDKTTCVEYLTNNYQKKGGITVRYNKDGTIKINKECLESKGE